MLNDDELSRLDGHAQAELVRRGELTAAELAEAAAARIERYDGLLNCVPVRRFAEAVDEAARLPRTASPLAGVPMLLKDLGPTCAGAEATAGSAFLAGFTPGQDAELVRRYRRAGLVVLGKARTAEFGVLPTTEPRHGGPAVNPWAPDRSTGGSSGGSAAAVAAGLVAVAHANDAGGSIRIPASCCGVFGLKPTRARTPLGPAVGDLMNGLACEHVVTRSVRDSAAILDATAGPAPGDPYPAPPAAPGTFLRAALTGPDRPLRIAVSTRPAASGRPVHPDCAEAVASAARLCADLGHTVVDQDPPVGFADLADPFLVVWAAGVSSAISGFAALSGRTPRPEHFEDLTWHLYEQGRRIPAADYLLAVTTLQRAARALAESHDGYDLLLTPVTAEPAPPLGTFAVGTPDEQMHRAVEFVHEAPLANLTGQPAMSVPLSVRTDGPPIGVQFTARYGADAELLALAAQLEQARPWSHRLPAALTDHLLERTP
ncbi:amidase [Kitasatospora sp. NPDC054939]